MRNLPTDLELLEEIYRRYLETYVAYSDENPGRSTKLYVPIDVKVLAAHFETDADIIFGRLYYHMEQKYGFTDPEGSKVPFFAVRVGSDKHAIQFPLLASILASLREEQNRYLWATWLSIAALALSVVSVVLSIVTGKP